MAVVTKAAARFKCHNRQQSRIIWFAKELLRVAFLLDPGLEAGACIALRKLALCIQKETSDSSHLSQHIKVCSEVMAAQGINLHF